ncbi:hypothetical protein LV155_005385 [Aspergillus fumigatus]|nr:hypothetical protein KXV43_004698 [Aspergillus fumigatus]KAJ8157154.1 hypothetical protein LV155_005385 [Aspergillus fumigatus]
MVALNSTVERPDSALFTGAILTTTKSKNGTYHVRQNKQSSSLNFFGRPPQNEWASFNATIGTINVTGTINHLSFDTVMEVHVAGLCLGAFTGNPQLSFTIGVDLECANGELQLTAVGDDIYLKVDMALVQVGKDKKAERVKLSESPLSEREKHLLSIYGKLPHKGLLGAAAKHRTYFDSGDYALAAAHKVTDEGDIQTGTAHPLRESIPHPYAPVPSSGNVAGDANKDSHSCPSKITVSGRHILCTTIVEHHEDDPRSPHLSLYHDGSGQRRKEGSQRNLGRTGMEISWPFRAAINIKSGDTNDSRLVYWIDRDFSQHSIIDRLSVLKPGFHLLEDTKSSPDGPRVGFIRSNLFNVNSGRVLPQNIEGPDNDIIDLLEPEVRQAIERQAEVYVFGARFDTKDGIHDVHMNQGNKGRWKGITPSFKTEHSLFISQILTDGLAFSSALHPRQPIPMIGLGMPYHRRLGVTT